MDNVHTLICIMGRSACGKDTLVDMLSQRTGIKKLISYTTRERRNNEGDTHIFVDKNDYYNMLKDGKIAAFTEINDNFYWSTYDQIMESDIYIIDYIGYEELKKLNIPNLRLVSIYIFVDEETRSQRATELRGDDIKTFRLRSFNERQQFNDVEKNMKFDYAIKNKSLDKAYSTLRWIIAIESGLSFKNNNKGVSEDE